MSRDTRICFVGDSFVAGVGDPSALGWAGRLVADAHACGHPVTAYNLGVRRQTSSEIRARWLAESLPRLPDGADARVVFSFGVNDTMIENGRQRVAATDSVTNLTALLAEAADRGWPALVVAPPPIDDDEHNARTAALDARFAELCVTAAVPYVRTHQRLSADPVWRHEVRIGDGAHPGAEGYAVLAELIRPTWREWLSH
ncbi:GDSL-type esterase/lipase family protein [Nocardia cyriacigeorgica]|uniref:GDSL-type esterase/lipase family protein n=1 Tax=Nocardia cyriacigeorgica TaxID=135487 RepID=UPI001893B3AB|nr:GDSL-type esterase/lipase family protein [Nocardia cyriacigeorgica]MBF6437726.1 G-D-S-L family lipolytic protein [Nocardia cyriacigeorgica]